MMKKTDLMGRQFGELTVIKDAGKSKDRHALWECLCFCGNKCVVAGNNLQSGNTKSCGCLKKKIQTTHGMSGTSYYLKWKNMIRRCTNLNDPQYSSYGGRGIKVCSRWFKIKNFLKDMGECPEGLTLERIDNNKGYCKKNCDWRSRTEQSRNQRIRKTNKTGFAGVWYDKKRQKYIVHIATNYKQIHIGQFVKLEDARLARQKAEQKYWGKKILRKNNLTCKS